jgi:hypothetical protein
MERTGSHSAPGSAPDDARADAPAIRDAAWILARVAADEAATALARDRYRTEPMQALEPDARIAPLLAPDERLLAVRRSVVLDRRQSTTHADFAIGVAGSLYMTARRLILVGRLTLAFNLEDIDEAVLSGERLLLVLRDGNGVSLDVAQPRLLRVEIATARASARGGSASEDDLAQPGS